MTAVKVTRRPDGSRHHHRTTPRQVALLNLTKEVVRVSGRTKDDVIIVDFDRDYDFESGFGVKDRYSGTSRLSLAGTPEQLRALRDQIEAALEAVNG